MPAANARQPRVPCSLGALLELCENLFRRTDAAKRRREATPQHHVVCVLLVFCRTNAKTARYDGRGRAKQQH